MQLLLDVFTPALIFNSFVKYYDKEMGLHGLCICETDGYFRG